MGRSQIFSMVNIIVYIILYITVNLILLILPNIILDILHRLKYFILIWKNKPIQVKLKPLFSQVFKCRTNPSFQKCETNFFFSTRYITNAKFSKSTFEIILIPHLMHSLYSFVCARLRWWPTPLLQLL